MDNYKRYLIDWDEMKRDILKKTSDKGIYTISKYEEGYESCVFEVKFEDEIYLSNLEKLQNQVNEIIGNFYLAEFVITKNNLIFLEIEEMIESKGINL